MICNFLFVVTCSIINIIEKLKRKVKSRGNKKSEDGKTNMGSYKQGKKGENKMNREIEIKKWNDHFKKLY